MGDRRESAGVMLGAPRIGDPVRRDRLAIAIVVAGLAVAAVAWRSDQLGLTVDNATVDPWQKVGIVAGLAIGAIGIGVVLATVSSARSTSLQRGVAGSGAAVTTIGWLLMLFFVAANLDCAANPTCSAGDGFRPSRHMYGLLPDWQLSVALIAASTVVAAWGLWGIWRRNGLTPRSSTVLYWAGSTVTWILMISAYTGQGMSIEA